MFGGITNKTNKPKRQCNESNGGSCRTVQAAAARAATQGETQRLRIGASDSSTVEGDKRCAVLEKSFNSTRRETLRTMLHKPQSIIQPIWSGKNIPTHYVTPVTGHVPHYCCSHSPFFLACTTLVGMNTLQLQEDIKGGGRETPWRSGRPSRVAERDRAGPLRGREHRDAARGARQGE